MSNREYLKEKIIEYRKHNDGKIHNPMILLRQFDNICSYKENYNNKNYCFIDLIGSRCISIDINLKEEVKVVYTVLLLAKLWLDQKDDKDTKGRMISTLEDLQQDKDTYSLCKDFAKDLLLNQNNLDRREDKDGRKK